MIAQEKGEYMEENILERADILNFLNETINNITHYKLFENEQFSKYILGVLFSSEQDLHGDCYTADEIMLIKKNMDQKIVWVNVNHDPSMPPVGRIIDTKIFLDSKNITYLVCVTGNYNKSSYQSFSSILPKLVEDRFTPLFNNSQKRDNNITISYNPYEINKDIIEELSKNVPDDVHSKLRVKKRKAAEPNCIINFLIPVIIIYKLLVPKILMDKISEDVYSWLKKSIRILIKKITQSHPVVILETKYKDCLIQFIIKSKKIEDVYAAMNSLEQINSKPFSLYNQLKKYIVTHIIYVYNIEHKLWFGVVP